MTLSNQKTKQHLIIIVLGSIFSGLVMAGVDQQTIWLQTESHKCIRTNSVIADNPDSRSRGFQHQPSGIDGILFQWPETTKRRFWMKDTHIPLILIRMTDSGVVTDWHVLLPMSLKIYSDSRSGRYAFEVRQDRLPINPHNDPITRVFIPPQTPTQCSQFLVPHTNDDAP
jgi:uncharacterized membrane protein (UPF0127 family)